MKKIIMVLCVAASIFLCNAFLAETVYAEDRLCTTHTLNAEVPGTYQGSYNHPYVINTSSGPNYETCHVTYTCDCIYLRCTVCGYIDDHPYNCHNYRNYVHSACGQ